LRIRVECGLQCVELSEKIVGGYSIKACARLQYKGVVCSHKFYTPLRYGIETESLTNGIRVERIAPTKNAVIDKGTKGLRCGFFLRVARERLALKEERQTFI
jgi:hypothetical protein